MEEIWKGISGYEESYQVSNLGNVRSLNYRRTGKTKNLVPKVNNSGRLWVELCKQNTRKQMLIHRLVGEAFIPNPNDLPQINHKDENPKNNCVENLEWCTGEYNNLYSLVRHPERWAKRKPTPKYRRMLNREVLQIDQSGEVVNRWGSACEIFHSLGYSQWSITQCCDGKRHTAYGFKWQYAT